MTYFVSTALGFITSNKIDPEFPKQCIDQSRSRDVRWAFPFNSWNEANSFANRLTSGPHWPPGSRYFAIMTSASPNIKDDEPPMKIAEELFAENRAKKQGITDRIRSVFS